MKKKKSTLLALIFGVFGIVLIGTFWVENPKVTEAACGASTTSCKTCHEVKGENPVSQKGDWHTQHAFADFCQACHLGAATETDKTKSHAGIVANPLTQPDESCASCHPADTATRVVKYGGEVTGVPAGNPTSGTSSGATGTETNQTESGSVTPSAAAAQIPPGMNTNFDVIDFNVTDKIPWLGWLIGIINAVMLLVLGGLIWRWKKGLWPWAFLAGRTKKVPFNSLPLEVQEVFNQLLEGDIKTVVSLEKILKSECGPQVLQAVSNLPDNVLFQLRTLGEKDLKSVSSLSDLLKNEGSEQNRGV
ncbi:cytochrome c3 family protein [Desulfosporosinus lacus]|uniref:Uncharacterized protein n=1 Tax=Desulfosporosinus lacus DSM 15449 TaxID=1121420 RepID=A0A1M6BLW3_9FIRM|nr:cytochrome c3 family protein [Desulfosporosinus lacus]SHI49719.1 hypothetical protein SAMN02746098_04182 [Desulfosporosinus lacus DSM 15449]